MSSVPSAFGENAEGVAVRFVRVRSTTSAVERARRRPARRLRRHRQRVTAVGKRGDVPLERARPGGGRPAPDRDRGSRRRRRGHGHGCGCRERELNRHRQRRAASEGRQHRRRRAQAGEERRDGRRRRSGCRCRCGSRRRQRTAERAGCLEHIRTGRDRPAERPAAGRLGAPRPVDDRGRVGVTRHGRAVCRRDRDVHGSDDESRAWKRTAPPSDPLTAGE